MAGMVRQRCGRGKPRKGLRRQITHEKSLINLATST